jgi:hypothetical protein
MFYQPLLFVTNYVFIDALYGIANTKAKQDSQKVLETLFNSIRDNFMV